MERVFLKLPVTDMNTVKKTKEQSIFGLAPIKVLFAMEYVLQGLANPFQGITYHPFFKHFHFTYGLSEAATQALFSKSYLAWSFKPVIGFFMDAYGKTRTALIVLMLGGCGLYLLTPLIDRSASLFFWSMFVLSVLFAATDVSVDRATIITGDEEAKTSGKSKAATVGLNQAICWAAIYGTSIVAGFSGGWIADNIPIGTMLAGLAVVPLIVLLVVLRLPRDTATTIPVRQSVANFWNGLNTGPVLWIVLFYFLFHFQPAMGALWTNYLISTLHFTQTQIGASDSVSYVGYFSGVILFAWLGIRWQNRFGLRTMFRVYILISIGINLTQYLMVEPYFSRITDSAAAFFPGVSRETVRWGYFAGYSFFSAIAASAIRMSTFSLVGAVIPVAAAGSLFAGFMSVANLAYSFSYASGAWLYENGMEFSFLRHLQTLLFDLPAIPGKPMSITLLILIGSIAYLLSFLAVHMLPDKKQTQAVDDDTQTMISPDCHATLGTSFLRSVNRISIASGALISVVLCAFMNVDIIAGIILGFLAVTFFRKLFLDRRYRKSLKNHGMQ